MRQWKITDIRMSINKNRKVNNALLANVSITIDDCLVIHEIKVVDGKKGPFVSMPQMKDKRNDKWRDVCHPLDTSTRQYISSAVLSVYQSKMQEENKEVNSNGQESEAQKEIAGNES